MPLLVKELIYQYVLVGASSKLSLSGTLLAKYCPTLSVRHDLASCFIGFGFGLGIVLDIRWAIKAMLDTNILHCRRCLWLGGFGVLHHSRHQHIALSHIREKFVCQVQCRPLRHAPGIHACAS